MIELQNDGLPTRTVGVPAHPRILSSTVIRIDTPLGGERGPPIEPLVGWIDQRIRWWSDGIRR